MAGRLLGLSAAVVTNSTLFYFSFEVAFMKNLKKVTLTVAVVALFSICAHAVPGMVQYIPDTSGEYVYYSDKSFKRTSILGFLYYDDGTYAVRYYAPADTK
ncbi:MAG: hypothetical protein II547_03395, partial [Treponema sp.]|nr:hypothetical protein [Treponema sp.]